MSRQQKIRAFERRGYKVVFGQHFVFIVRNGYPYTRTFNSVNDAYNHRPW